MTVKRDKLGRRIPTFDRSKAAKKATETRKEKYGPDYQSRIGTAGGRVRTRGYLGKLKDEGKINELRAVQKKGQEASKAKAAEVPSSLSSRKGCVTPA